MAAATAAAAAAAAAAASATHVLHFADVHLRAGDVSQSRREEYMHVFDGLEARLDALECVRAGTAVAVVCGDVFHHKHRLEGCTVQLWTRFVRLLSDRAPVLLISGNHDFRQERPGDPDLLETMVAALPALRHPCTHLRDTGVYTCAGVRFGVVAVQETLDALDTCGLVQALPPFPDPAEGGGGGGGVAVALFHGTITQSALPNGQLAPAGHGYPLEWFRGYDLALLGDNHLQQVHAASGGLPAWGYPGSLVQQDHGEPLLGHGFLVWDLATRAASPVHVRNDYGRLRARVADGGRPQVRLSPGEEYVALASVPDAALPRRPAVSVWGNVGDDAVVAGALAARGVRPSSLTTTLSVGGAAAAGGVPGVPGAAEGGEGGEGDEGGARVRELARAHHPGQWLRYVRAVDPELAERVGALRWLDEPERLLQAEADDDAVLPAELRAKVRERHARVQEAVRAYRACQEAVRARPAAVRLLYLEWAWVFAYGERNWFDFRSTEGDVSVLNGGNACGKSAFIDVLCIALFGEPGKARQALSGQGAKRMSSRYIHHQKPARAPMHAWVAIEVRGQAYVVERAYTPHRMRGDDQGVQMSRCEVSRVVRVEADDAGIGGGEAWRCERVCSGATLVDAWVRERCGTLEDVLESTVVSQQDLHNFFMLRPAEQKERLDQALNLEGLQAYGEALHQAVLAHNAWLEELGAHMQGGRAALQLDLQLEGGDGGGEDAEAELRAAAAAAAAAAEAARAWERACHEAAALCGGELPAVADTLCGSSDCGSPEAQEVLRAPDAPPARSLEALDAEAAALAAWWRAAGLPGEPPGLGAGDGAAQAEEVARGRLEGAEAALLAAERELVAWRVQAGAWLGAEGGGAEGGGAEAAWQEACAAAAAAAARAHRSAQALADAERDWMAARPERAEADAASWEAQHAAWRARAAEADAAGWPASAAECEARLREAEAAAAAAREREAAREAWRAEEAAARAQTTARSGAEARAVLAAWQARQQARARFCREWEALEAEHRALRGAGAVPLSATLRRLERQQARAGWPRTAAEAQAALQRALDAQRRRARLADFAAEAEAELRALRALAFNPACAACRAHPSHQRRAALEAALADARAELRGPLAGGARAVDAAVREAQRASAACDEVERLRGAGVVVREAACRASRARCRRRLAALDAWLAESGGAATEAEALAAAEAAVARWAAVEALQALAAQRCGGLAEAEAEEAEAAARGWRRAVEVRRDQAARAPWQAAEAAAWARARAAWAPSRELQARAAALRAEAGDLGEAARAAGRLAAAALRRAAPGLEARRAAAQAEAARWREVAAALPGRLAAGARLREERAAAAAWAGVREAAARAYRARSAGLAAARAELRAREGALADAEARGRRRREQGARLGALDRVCARWRARRDLLLALHRRLIGDCPETYKEWVYAALVLPLLEQHVNTFLACVGGAAPAAPLRMSIEYHAKALRFIVHDRGNATTLGLSSGFQQFLIGLAMRLAMTRLGGRGGRLQTLIIDEGFVACDADNLLRARDTLAHMMEAGGFRQVLLATHLDAIKDAVPRKIPIRREGAFSRLQVGARVRRRAEAPP